MGRVVAGILGMLTLVTLARVSAADTVLFVDSYHAGYGWSDDIRQGVADGLAGSGHRLVNHFMDTKRNGTEEFKLEAGRRARRAVDEVKPQVVIACDDNAARYLVADSMMQGPVPVVFCGVNWDASKYGLPNGNVTGIVEVQPVREVIALMQKFAAGKRLALVTSDAETERIHVDNIVERFPQFPVTYVGFAKTIAEFETAYREANAQADMVIILNHAGIADWDEDRARAFIAANARIISGAFDRWMSPFVVVSVIKTGEEQGRWAARAALKILGGASPASIPVAANREGQIVFNKRLARQLGITLPANLLAMASEVIDE